MARGDFPSAKQDQYMLRFPDGMRERLKAIAAENGRSMNAEIIARLEASFDESGASVSEPAVAAITEAVVERLRDLTSKEVERILGKKVGGL